MASKFDDWSDVVDCNNCARYWDSSCDGVKPNERKNCNSYIATRSLVLPERMKRMEDRMDMFQRVLISFMIGVLLFVACVVFFA